MKGPGSERDSHPEEIRVAVTVAIEWVALEVASRGRCRRPGSEVTVAVVERREDPVVAVVAEQIHVTIGVEVSDAESVRDHDVLRAQAGSHHATGAVVHDRDRLGEAQRDDVLVAVAVEVGDDGRHRQRQVGPRLDRRRETLRRVKNLSERL